MIVASGSDKDWLEEDWLTNLIYFGGNSDANSLLSEIGQDNEETSLAGVQWLMKKMVYFFPFFPFPFGLLTWTQFSSHGIFLFIGAILNCQYASISGFLIMRFPLLNRLFWQLLSFKGGPYSSHFIFEINVGKRRIRHRTTLNSNDAIFNRFWVDLEIKDRSYE